MSSIVTDEQLLQEMAQGQGAALETLVYRYRDELYAYLYRMLNSAPLAEDYTQECFLRLMETVRKGKLPMKFRPWIYTVAGNLCRDLWKKAAYQREWLNNEYAVEVAAEDNITSIFEKQMERERVVHALHSLKEEDRNLIVLRFYQELKFEEIAEIVQLSVSTVKRKVYQGLRQLQHAWAEIERAEHANSEKLRHTSRVEGGEKR